jgi:hypothetical protein
MMKYSDALEFAFFIQIIQHTLIWDTSFSPFRLCTCRRAFKRVELGHKLDSEMTALGKEHTRIENLTGIFGKCLTVFDK